MEKGNGLIAAIVVVVILAVVVIGAMAFRKPKNNTRAISSRNTYRYTDKDRDMLSLIHELATIYDNTDKYLNS